MQEVPVGVGSDDTVTDQAGQQSELALHAVNTRHTTSAFMQVITAQHVAERREIEPTQTLGAITKHVRG